VSGNFLKIEMADLKERVCVKFCFLLGRTPAQTVLMLKEAFKNEAMEVHKWFNHFKRGKMSVEDQLRCGHPSTSRTDQNLENVPQAVSV